MDDYEQIGNVQNPPDAPSDAVEEKKPRALPSAQPSAKRPKALRDDDVDLNSNPISKPMEPTSQPRKKPTNKDNSLTEPSGKTKSAITPVMKTAIQKGSKEEIKDFEDEVEPKSSSKTPCRVLFGVGVIMLVAGTAGAALFRLETINLE